MKRKESSAVGKVEATMVVVPPTDVAECEACLKLFPTSYLNGHRLKLHRLTCTEYGCPYCQNTFSTMNQRMEHIHSKHPCQPLCAAKHLLERTRCFINTCSECEATTTMNYTDLKNHIQNEHSKDIFKRLDRMKAACPFCVSIELFIRLRICYLI